MVRPKPPSGQGYENLADTLAAFITLACIQLAVRRLARPVDFESAPGADPQRNTRDEAVKQLRTKANELTERVVTVAQHVQTGLPCWGSELIPAEDREHERQKLDELKAFLEGLQAFDTPGKLKNFAKSVLEIRDMFQPSIS